MVERKNDVTLNNFTEETKHSIRNFYTDYIVFN